MANNTNASSIALESHWSMLGLLIVIVTSAMGNLLVCLAVCLEKRLQNMTNYFLLSLALADLLVSLLVMPLGMIVEVYGYFPADPYLCTVWVSMDVLLCTASIWHMCTMSMDRFFTLKYPMRYGRNKTRRMVIIKIMIVWMISGAICSPVFIMGFVDVTNIFNNGQCIPVMYQFIIYGSVFAFFVPLCIMLVTYVLTVRLLWKNQKLVKEMKENGCGHVKKSHMKRRSFFSKSYSQDDSSRNDGSLDFSDKYHQIQQTDSKGNRHKVPIAGPRHPASRLLYSTRIGQQTGYMDSLAVVETDGENSETHTNNDELPQQKRYLNIPSSPKNVITSDSFLSDTDVDESGAIKQNNTCGSPEEDEQTLARNRALLNKRLHAIQKEMDQCLKKSEGQEDSEPSNGLHIAKPSILSDSAESDVDSSSNADEILTVKLKPEAFYMYRLNVDEYNSNRRSLKGKEETSFLRRKSTKRHRPQMLLQSPSDASGTESGTHHTKLKRKRSLREFMRHRVSLRLPHSAHLTRSLTKLLPSHAATNERKASKVLGIIFAVFVVLWTPFFITNILSGICNRCLQSMTTEMMSTFLWMGYVASLANPIIYTMFNTSFRKAFVKILCCKYSCSRTKIRRRQSDSHVMTFTATGQSDRRNTVTMVIDR